VVFLATEAPFYTLNTGLRKMAPLNTMLYSIH
jgi:hypothetical protein